MPIIEAKDLEMTYHSDDVETRVLRGLTFSIESGEFVAIMGPSGSGKSTLLHILGFLDRHTGGEYRFEGKTIDDYSKAEIAHVRNKKMGFVFQAFNLLPRTTVLDNVMLPLIYSETKKSLRENLALKAIDSVGLTHRASYETSKLSGGEKQRVAIARALVNSPNIIFADEPTGNLDSKSGQSIMKIIQELNEKQGHTIILITHETYTANHAERLINILDGRIQSDTQISARHKATEHYEK
jgi:putative ABC transport system ATP-binding protein